MNNNQENIIFKAIEKLHEKAGLITKFRPALNTTLLDGTLEVQKGDRRIIFNIEAKKELRGYHLPGITEQAKINEPLIVIAENIFPKLKEELRKQKIAYIDNAGNAFIDYENIVIWIDGQKNDDRQTKITNRAFTKAGLKVVFYLLIDEKTINLPYRAIAEKVDVGLGNINYVMNDLKEMGYILQVNDKKKKIQKRKELIDRWVNGFEAVLKPALYIGNYRFVQQLDFRRWATFYVDTEDTVWGGEAAGELLTNNLNPAKLTLYTKKNKAEIMKQFKVVPDVNGNLAVYEKFWNFPPYWLKPTVPPLLAYADLMLTGDPRCQDIAKMIYDKFISNEY